MEQNIAVYEDGVNLRLQVKADGDAVRLTQEQMLLLFGRDQSVKEVCLYNLIMSKHVMEAA